MFYQFQTTRSRLIKRKEALPNVFNQVRGVWKSAETLSRVFDITLQIINLAKFKARDHQISHFQTYFAVMISLPRRTRRTRGTGTREEPLRERLGNYLLY